MSVDCRPVLPRPLSGPSSRRARPAVEADIASVAPQRAGPEPDQVAGIGQFSAAGPPPVHGARGAAAPRYPVRRALGNEAADHLSHGVLPHAAAPAALRGEFGVCVGAAQYPYHVEYLFADGALEDDLAKFPRGFVPPLFDLGAPGGDFLVAGGRLEHG